MHKEQISPELLAAIHWAQQRPPLSQPQKQSQPPGYGSLDFTSDWLPLYRVADLVDDILGRGGFVGQMLDLYQIPRIETGLRPRAKSTMAVFSESVHRSDFVYLLIQMERLALAVDPSPWAQMLRPGIVSHEYITGRECSILWYRQERGRCEPVRLGRVPTAGEEWAETHASTPLGYHISALAAQGAVRHLTIMPPRGRYSRRRPLITSALVPT